MLRDMASEKYFVILCEWLVIVAVLLKLLNDIVDRLVGISIEEVLCVTCGR